MVGTIIPAGLLMVLAVIYLASGGQSQMNFDGNFFPDFSNFDNTWYWLPASSCSMPVWKWAVSMSQRHGKSCRNYPKAVLKSAAITVIIFVLGTFALGIIIPEKDINLTQSLLVGFDNYFRVCPCFVVVAYHRRGFGIRCAGRRVDLAGPSKGIFAVGKAGYLPPSSRRPTPTAYRKTFCWIQGLAVTLLSLLFVVMPSVQSFTKSRHSSHRIVLPYHVSADVQLRHLSAFTTWPRARSASAAKATTDVAHRRSGFLRFAAPAFSAQLHSAPARLR